MDHCEAGGQLAAPYTYDHRLFDRIWQRVSPELTPYPELRAAGESGEPSGETALLPGAVSDPCCMGSAAADDAAVLRAFAAGEAAQSRCCLELAAHICRRDAQRLLRQLAEEKRQAYRQLRAALYLIDGACREEQVKLEPMRWPTLADALRACYHQEACGGFNYLRAADGTADPCLQRLLRQLGEQAYSRAASLMSLLGRILDKQCT